MVALCSSFDCAMSPFRNAAREEDEPVMQFLPALILQHSDSLLTKSMLPVTLSQEYTSLSKKVPRLLH